MRMPRCGHFRSPCIACCCRSHWRAVWSTTKLGRNEAGIDCPARAVALNDRRQINQMRCPCHRTVDRIVGRWHPLGATRRASGTKQAPDLVADPRHDARAG
jgi:hypothetical protein